MQPRNNAAIYVVTKYPSDSEAIYDSMPVHQFERFHNGVIP